MQRIYPKQLSHSLASHLQVLWNLAAVKSLREKLQGGKSELKEQSGGGNSAQPLREFAMFKTLSPATSGQTFSGGGRVRGQIGRTGGSSIPSYAAKGTTRRAVLAL